MRWKGVAVLVLMLAVGAFSLVTYLNTRDPTVLIVGIIAAAVLVMAARSAGA